MLSSLTLTLSLKNFDKLSLGRKNYPIYQNNKYLTLFTWPLKSTSSFSLTALFWNVFLCLDIFCFKGLHSSPALLNYLTFLLCTSFRYFNMYKLSNTFSYFTAFKTTSVVFLAFCFTRISSIFNFIFFNPFVFSKLNQYNYFLTKKHYNFFLFLSEFLSSFRNVSLHQPYKNCTKLMLTLANVPYYTYNFVNKNLSYIYLKTNSKSIVFLSFFLKKNMHLLLKGLYDLVVIDYPTRLLRFELVYCFLSLYTKLRLFAKMYTTEHLRVPSLSSLYSSANWLEREVWDLFGIFFTNHKNLRRILTDYGFKGFPFRKDFPLTGYIEVRFDDSTYSVVYEPLEVTQEFRVFNFKSPWENYIV